jgi:hypothetical protein
VTAALGQLVHAAAQQAIGGGVGLNLGRPTVAAEGDTRRVHVYLYQVTPNAALRNADLPLRHADGRLVRRSQAALDLHYLLAFSGDPRTLEPERMLGAVARDLHTHAVLSAQAITDAITSIPELNASDLALAVERIKFTPAMVSLDEMSKLWSIFVQTPHLLSIAYQCSVVLIDGEESPSGALPVLRRGEGDRGVDARLGALPQLDGFWFGSAAAAAERPRPLSLPAAQLGTRMAIAGSALAGDAVRLRFAHPRLAPLELAVGAAQRSAQELACDLPDDAAAQTQWAAGIYSVAAQVTRAPAPRPLGSNALPFALAPRIVAINPNPAPRDTAGAVSLDITCRPEVLPEQSALLLLGERQIAAEPRLASSATLTFAVEDAPALSGAPARVRVDGVDSLPFRYDPATRGFAFDDAQRITIT